MTTPPASRGSAPQAELFGPALLHGLTTSNDFVEPDEEQALIARIGSAKLGPFRFQQWEGKRLTRSFGWSYDFENGAFSRADPLPGWLLPLAERAAVFAGVEPREIAQALLIEYGPGAGIGWHCDRPAYEHVIGISLGHPATLRFRKRDGDKFTRFALPLAPRSIYHLSGEARNGWEHSIVPIEAPRWSVTFRTLRDPYGP